MDQTVQLALIDSERLSIKAQNSQIIAFEFSTTFASKLMKNSCHHRLGLRRSRLNPKVREV